MLAPLPLGYFRIWCQNLVSIQAPVVYETSVDADPFGKLRPRIFPRERLFCFRCGWNNEVTNLFFLAKGSNKNPQSGSLREQLDLLVRSPTPPCITRLATHAQPPCNGLDLKGVWSGCTRGIRTPSPPYEGGKLPLLHQCYISESFQHPLSFIPTSH